MILILNFLCNDVLSQYLRDLTGELRLQVDLPAKFLRFRNDDTFF